MRESTSPCPNCQKGTVHVKTTKSGIGIKNWKFIEFEEVEMRCDNTDCKLHSHEVVRDARKTWNSIKSKL